MKCIIVEDEPLALERLRGYVLKLPFLSLEATFDNGSDALLYLHHHSVDLIFLDINLGELSGLELLEIAAPQSAVILTTAYDAYAVKGFELQVTDYLLKPFTFERFATAVNHAKQTIPAQQTSTVVARPFLFVKTEHRLEKLLFSDILYVEGVRDYRRIYTLSRKIMTLQTFRELESIIPEQSLCRVHKSYMVAPDKIDTIERDLIHIGNATIPMSDTYKKRFLELIGH